MRIAASLLLLSVFCFAGLASATFVRLLDPVQQTIEAGSNPVVYLGLVGPGQKVEVVMDNDTGELSQGGITVSKSNANWNILKVDDTTLPPGWRGQASGLYEAPLKAYVIVSPTAPDGDYQFSLQAINNYGDVPPLKFAAKATISRQVLSLSITSDPVKVGLTQPAEYELQIYNSGNANDVFQLTAQGIPGQKPVSVQVFVPKESKVTQKVLLAAAEPGAYDITFTATSLSSAQISQRASTTLFAGSNLLTDARASARGFLLFPSAETYVYSLWSIIGSLFG